MKYKSHLAKVDRNEQIVKEHLAGKSFYQIAKELKLHPTRVASIFHFQTDGKYKKVLVNSSELGRTSNNEQTNL